MSSPISALSACSRPISFQKTGPTGNKNIEMSEKILSGIRRWMIQASSSYLDLYGREALCLAGFDSKKKGFLARVVPKKTSLLLACFKTLSYITLVFPLVALLALFLGTRNLFFFQQESDSFRALYARYRWKKRIANRSTLLYQQPLFPSSRKSGGSLLLTDRLWAWISFKHKGDKKLPSWLFLKTAPLPQDATPLLAQARLCCEQEEDHKVHLKSVFIYKEHPWLKQERSGKSPQNSLQKEEKLKAIYRILFGAAVRYVDQNFSIQGNPSIVLYGETARSLTHDGYEVIPQSYISKRYEPENPFSPASEVEVPCQEFIQQAFQQLELPQSSLS